MAFPLQNIYNHSFQPLWKAKKKNATELPTIMESSTKKKTKKQKCPPGPLFWGTVYANLT